MATKQQLRGDGSKEYQIITNLSRGINNAVADDVLVDNAFRDVVNFSSDQLGNISKRDNLLNSNFKEFLRKLAYGDYNLDVFKNPKLWEIKKQVRYGYKSYSYGTVDQIHLQHLYETLFTNKKYTFNTFQSTYTGVGKDTKGNLTRVPTFIGMSDYEYEDTEIDTGVTNQTDKLKSKIVTENTQDFVYSDGMKVACTETFSWHYENSDELIAISSEGLPEGWVVTEDGKHLQKYFDNVDYNDFLIVKLNDEENTEFKLNVGFDSGNEMNYAPKMFSYNDTGTAYEIIIYLTQNTMGGGRPANITSIRSFAKSSKTSSDNIWQFVDQEINNEIFIVAKGTFSYEDIEANDYLFEATFYMTENQPVKAIIQFNNIDNVPDKEKYRGNLEFGTTSNYTLKKIFIQKQDNFFKALQNLDKIFKEGDYVDNEELDYDIALDVIFVSYAETKHTMYSIENIKYNNNPLVFNVNDMIENHSFNISRLVFRLSKDYTISVLAYTRTAFDDSLLLTDEEIFYEMYGLDVLLANLHEDALNDIFCPAYNKKVYLPTGFTSIIAINLDTASSSPKTFLEYIGTRNKLGEMGNVNNNIYAPTPYEIKNPGFNLLSDKPLTYISSAGTVNKIRGVYYTLNGTTVLREVPCNIPFEINVIYTGSTKPNKPQIRPNTGDLDESSNPYTELSGNWEETATNGVYIFKCNGIDTVEDYEMKITQGTDKYLTYFTPEPYVPKDEFDLSTLSRMVYSCPRAKIINNQLVMFGNEGYIFFSDFENFTYFPNYYYLNINGTYDEIIIDIVYFRQFYAIFTNKRILRMSGDFGADNFELGPLNDFMGCVNHSTIRQVYNSLYFIGYNGIYSLNQGYLGSGTENLKRIDTQLTNTFNFDNVSYCYVMGNTYIIIMNDGKTWYTYDVDNDMFLRYDYSLGDNSTLSSISFIETLEENQIYAILAINKEGKNYTDDLLLYNFPLVKDVNYDYKDSAQGYISAFETPYVNLGSPTNTKKFKNLFIKMYNETDSLIPLYVTVYVDDILALSPEDYVVELDEETNTYFYYFKAENNAELLKAHNLLGELTLGKDTLGDNIIQQLKLKINAKGRAIKIILADGYDYPNKDNSAIIKYRNNKKFSISTIGIVYKLKKVKEG